MSKLYSVEKIINKRNKKDEVEYLVKWVGYPKNQSTWEPYSNLKVIQYLIDDFERSHIEQTENTDNTKQGLHNITKAIKPSNAKLLNKHIINISEDNYVKEKNR